MKIHVLQHVPFEEPAGIAEWAQLCGHTITIVCLFNDEKLPGVADFDRLIVMGGPMGVNDEAEYPWLQDEKILIQEAISAGRSVVGICLGAQLIADTLGARVYPGKEKEIGWFPVQLTQTGREHAVSRLIPDNTTVFHWHSDTFDLPRGAFHLMRSGGCEHQAFLYNDRVLGLQFHLETTCESVSELTVACSDEVVCNLDSRYVQSVEQLISGSEKYDSQCNRALFKILDWLPD